MAGENQNEKQNEKLNPVVFNCPQCAASLEISAKGYTTSIVCKSCHSILDAHHPLHKKIGQFDESTKAYKPYFELGTFGTLKGVKWKIIGFAIRMDIKYSFSWEEYLLYNPYKGFKWLLRIDGHFSVTDRLKSYPVSDKLLVEHENKTYKLFNEGEVSVEYVVGEFYWRVKQGELVTMKDYISPPYIISQEVSLATEVNWSISEYMTNAEVTKAFNPEGLTSSSEPHSVAANQPNPYTSTKLSKRTFVACLVLIALAFLSFVSKPSKVVWQDKVVKVVTMDKTIAPLGFVSPSFQVSGKKGNIEVTVDSLVHNQWVDAGITLVNEITGEDFSFNQGVEYYSGRDSDGSWSEGSQTDSKIISVVPGGLYHIEVELTGDMPIAVANIKVTRNAGMSANFIVALLLLLLPPIWTFWLSRSFEINRWSQSDHSPYQTDEGDDDE